MYKDSITDNMCEGPRNVFCQHVCWGLLGNCMWNHIARCVLFGLGVY